MPHSKNFAIMLASFIVLFLISCGGDGYKVTVDVTGLDDSFDPPATWKTDSNSIPGELNDVPSFLLAHVVLNGQAEYDIDITGNGKYTFSHKLKDGEEWSLELDTAPLTQSCYFSSTSGTIDKANVDVTLTCADKYWRHPENLSSHINPAGLSVDEPDVAMNDRGEAIIVWHQSGNAGAWEYQVFKSELKNGVWTHPSDDTEGISPKVTSAYGPKVAMDNNGDAIIVWYDDTANAFMSEYRDGVWTHPEDENDFINLSGADGDNPRVAMDNNGNSIVVWDTFNSYGRHFMAEYRDGSWTFPSDLNDYFNPDGSSSYGCDIAMSDYGNALVVYEQPDDGALSQIFVNEYKKGLSEDSWSWVNPTGLANNISPDGTNASDPVVAMDANGDGIIAWSQNDSTRYQIFKAELKDGFWTYPTGLSDNISLPDSSCDYTSVAMDDNGNAIIAWEQNDAAPNGQIFISEYRTGAWDHPSVLSDNISPDGSTARYPVVAMDNNGQAVIAWIQDSSGGDTAVFMSEYRNGSWTHPEDTSKQISPSGSDAYATSDRLRLAVNNRGDAIIVWIGKDASGDRQVFMSEYR